MFMEWVYHHWRGQVCCYNMGDSLFLRLLSSLYPKVEMSFLPTPLALPSHCAVTDSTVDWRWRRFMVTPFSLPYRSGWRFSGTYWAQLEHDALQCTADLSPVTGNPTQHANDITIINQTRHGHAHRKLINSLKSTYAHYLQRLIYRRIVDVLAHHTTCVWRWRGKEESNILRFIWERIKDAQ